jgi:hypothetical protein
MGPEYLIELEMNQVIEIVGRAAVNASLTLSFKSEN